VTYCPGQEPINLTKAEIERVGFIYGNIKEIMDKYEPSKLKEGMNIMPNGEEIFYISNPALGLWAFKDRFTHS